MEGIKLSRGLTKIPIYFEGQEEPDYIYINPADRGILERMKKAQETIQKKSKEVKPFNVDENGEADPDDCIRYLKEQDQLVYDALNFGFGSDVSSVLFKYLSPFSIVDGQYYVFYVLDALLPELQKIVKTGAEAANKKANKYYAKYKK